MTLYADLNPSVSIPFSRMRQLFEDTPIQAGVMGINNYKVAQRGAGANMSVDVPAGQAWVEVTTGTRNGFVHIVNDATANVTVTASNGTNPRIDQIVLRYNDSSIPTGSGDVPTLAVLTGTATSGATLANRTGAATLTADTLRLADILVPTSSTTVTTANIRDRRPWACGAYNQIVRNANESAGADYTTTSTTGVALDATNLAPRIECSGVPMRMRLIANGFHVTAGNYMSIFPTIDGASTINGGAYFTYQFAISGVAGAQAIVIDVPFTPTAGSHILGWSWLSSTATFAATLLARSNNPLEMVVEELVRQNASNT